MNVQSGVRLPALFIIAVYLASQSASIEAIKYLEMNKTATSNRKGYNQSSQNHYDHLEPRFGTYFIVASLTGIALVSLCILCTQCLLWIVQEIEEKSKRLATMTNGSQL